MPSPSYWEPLHPHQVSPSLSVLRSTLCTISDPTPLFSISPDVALLLLPYNVGQPPCGLQLPLSGW